MYFSRIARVPFAGTPSSEPPSCFTRLDSSRLALPRPSPSLIDANLICLVTRPHTWSDNTRLFICSLALRALRIKSLQAGAAADQPQNHPTFLLQSRPGSLPTSPSGRSLHAPTSTKTTKTRHRHRSFPPGDTAPLITARRPSLRHRPGPTLATLATSTATTTTRSASSCPRTLRTSYSPVSSADSRSHCTSRIRKFGSTTRRRTGAITRFRRLRSSIKRP